MKLIKRRPMSDQTPSAASPAEGPWEFLQPPLPWSLAMLVAIMAVIGFTLPWVTIDDHEEPLNAAGILTYYITAHDRWPVLKSSPLGALISFLAPAVIVTATVALIPALAMARKISVAALGMSLASLLAAAALLAWCSEILDPDLPRIGPFSVPGSGLATVIVAHFTIILAGCLPKPQQTKTVSDATGPSRDKNPASTEQRD